MATAWSRADPRVATVKQAIDNLATVPTVRFDAIISNVLAPDVLNRRIKSIIGPYPIVNIEEW